MANYLKLTWTNSCDLGRILYQDGYENYMFIDADLIKPDYNKEEEGEENQSGEFVKEYERLKKRYKFEMLCPEYIADALSLVPMHDNVLLSFTNELYSSQIRNIEVDVNWDDDFNGCMALVTFSFEQDDQVVKTNCCTNMS